MASVAHSHRAVEAAQSKALRERADTAERSLRDALADLRQTLADRLDDEMEGVEREMTRTRRTRRATHG